MGVVKNSKYGHTVYHMSIPVITCIQKLLGAPMYFTLYKIYTLKYIFSFFIDRYMSPEEQCLGGEHLSFKCSPTAYCSFS